MKPESRKRGFSASVRAVLSSSTAATSDDPPPYSSVPSTESSSHKGYQSKPQPKPIYYNDPTISCTSSSEADLLRRRYLHARDAFENPTRPHPSHSLSWPFQHPFRNVSRLQNLLHYIIVQDLNLGLLPTLAEEDAEYFLRLPAYLNAEEKLRACGGLLGMTQGGSYDYWNASVTQPLETLCISDMASLVELKIINFRGKFDIPPPTSSQTAANNNRNTDYWAAWRAKAHKRVDGALLEESLKFIHWEMRLIEAVFPYGDERWKTQALQHWKDVRALRFDEVNEDVFYEDESGEFQRRRSKGWRLRS